MLSLPKVDSKFFKGSPVALSPNSDFSGKMIIGEVVQTYLDGLVVVREKGQQGSEVHALSPDDLMIAPASVEMFWDKAFRSWVIVLKDENGNQCYDCLYEPHRAFAEIEKKRLESLYGLN